MQGEWRGSRWCGAHVLADAGGAFDGAAAPSA